MKILSLSGFMGCGKSSVGRILSGLTGAAFIDLDEYIENRSGEKIPEIFASEGEAGFRTKEKECLRDIISGSCDKEGLLILSLGGGTLTVAECAEIIHKDTLCIYLKASADTLAANLANDYASRPMLATESGLSASEDKKAEGTGIPDALRKRIGDLMSAREEVYESAAHIIINTDGQDLAAIAGQIVSILKSRRYWA